MSERLDNFRRPGLAGRRAGRGQAWCRTTPSAAGVLGPAAIPSGAKDPSSVARGLPERSARTDWNGTRSARRGFTLIEVLATLLLIAIALPVIMQAVSVATSAASSARHRNEAGALAESKLSELVVSGEWQTGATQGDFMPDWPNYQWRADVQAWVQPDVRQLDVHVIWTGRGGAEESLTVSTLIYPNAGAGVTSDAGSSTGGATGSGTGTGGTGTGGTR